MKGRFPLDSWSESFEIVEDIDVPSLSLADFATRVGLEWIDS